MKNEVVTFSFKTTTKKDPITNKPVLDDKGNEVKIPAPEAIKQPVPHFDSVTDVADIITKNDPKEVALLLACLNDVVDATAKDQLEEDEIENIRANGFDLSKLTWNAIANVPPGARGGGGIPEEVWNEFAKDYAAVMIHHGKTQEQAEMGAKFLLKKFNPVKMNKKVVSSLLNNLQVWAAHTASEGAYSKVYEFLTQRANVLLSTDEEAIVAAV